MKNLFLSIMLFIAFIAPVSADQLAHINKEQAEKAVSYLKERKVHEVILWGICENSNKIRLEIDVISYRYVGSGDYYEVMLTGRTSDGKEYSRGVDLSTVYLRNGKKAECLALLLGFNCKPCSSGFAWPDK